MKNLKTTWEAKLTDAGDDSGDAFVEFPNEIMAFYGLKEGDTFNLEVDGKAIKLNKVESLD